MGRGRAGWLHVAVGFVLIALTLAGCGGGGSSDGVTGSTATTTQAKDVPPGSAAGLSPAIQRRPKAAPPRSAPQARRVIKLVLTSNDAVACSRSSVTEHYLNASYGGHEGCVNARTPGSVADSIDLKSLRIEGDRATAVVVPSGGPYDAERIAVSLVADPRWAIDALHSNVPVGP
jgi:hypothetical protein